MRRHCRDAGKERGYARLLADYGVDQAAFSTLAGPPRLIYAEQPGCWYYGEDLIRARLLRTLVETGEFAPSSGVMSLCLDAFSDRGVKRWYTVFTFLDEDSEIHLLGSTFRRRHRHLTYAALPIDEATRWRLRTVFSTVADMLESARLSAETYAEHMIDRFHQGVEPGLRPMLPPAADRRSLLRQAQALRSHRLDEALGHLATPCTELLTGVHWSGFWNRVNARFFGQAIEPLGPLYNEFLLTISDPVRMARSLRHDLRTLAGQDDGRDVTVAGLITAHDKYRMVCFDADRESFYYCDGDEARIPISWDEVRRHAEARRTGGPAGVLAYLMMAAAGIYLVSDPVDGTSPFESAARTIHLRRLGLRYPSLAPEPPRMTARSGFLSLFTDAYDRCCAETLDRFCCER